MQESLVNEQLVPAGAQIAIYTDINTGVLQLKKGDFQVMAVAIGNGDAIIAANTDIAHTGFVFEIDPKYVDNLILLQKGADDLTAEVNAILAKAEAAGLYEDWYAEAEELAGIDTAADVSFDDEGNVVE